MIQYLKWSLFEMANIRISIFHSESHTKGPKLAKELYNEALRMAALGMFLIFAFTRA